jgi:hypothetical protein
MPARRIIKSPFVIILMAAIMAYWPIAFCIYTFKWDMLDVVFPFRYFAGECIQNGIFPLWNPYLLTGVPVCADLQYPIWSPEVWIIGLTTGYSIYTLHFLFISYLVLAGYGMYRLTLHFNAHSRTALLTGIAYMLSGFFAGHGQALFSIIGAAFLPWVILYMVKNCANPGLYRTLKLAVFLFLMLTTGYQFISIITGYLLLFILLYYLAVNLKTPIRLYKLIRYNGLLFILVLLLCLVLIVPLIQAAGYNDRLDAGLSYGKSVVCSFTWQSLISLVTPFATVKYPEFFGTDISMRNMHLGLIVLLIFTAGLFRKKSGIHWLILLFGMVCLLASFGSALPVHKLLFRYLPLISALRMPAYFNLFALFAIILSAGIHLNEIIRDGNGYDNPLMVLSVMATCLVIILTGYSLFHIRYPFPAITELFHHPADFFTSLNFHEHIIIQAPLQILFLICLIVFMRTGKLRKHLAKAVFILVSCEMIVAVNLNSYFTVYSAIRPHAIQAYIRSQPTGFPVPGKTAIMDNSDKNLTHDPLWRNMGIWTKKLSYDGFSSFILKPYNYVDDSLSELRDMLIRNPPVYLSGRVFRNSEIKLKHHPFNRGDLYVEDHVCHSLPSCLKVNTTGESLRMMSFSPVQCTVRYSLDSAAVITYLQADYPGWNVSIDGEETPHFTSNYMYLSSLVPAGEHQVTFRYENRFVFISFLISYSVFMLLLAGIIFLPQSRF